MPAFTTVLGLAAVAGSLVRAAPLAERSQPATYYTPYLEEYSSYHLRYLALDCQDQHGTAFFESCCHPLVVAEGQTLADRPSYCTPNATEIASASSYIASTSVSGAPATATDGGNGSPAPTTSSSDDGGASEYCEDEPSTSATPSTSTSVSASPSPSSSSSSVVQVAQASTAVAETATTTSSSLTTQAALAPTTTSTTQQAAPTTSSTQQAAPTTSANNNNNNGGVPSGANYGGYATFFYQNGNPGACGNYNSDSKPLVAIDKAWWPNFGQVSQYCGQYVTIQNTQNGKTVVAEVQDVCPTCANGNSLDLSVGAFTAIANEAEGQVPITWWFNN